MQVCNNNKRKSETKVLEDFFPSLDVAFDFQEPSNRASEPCELGQGKKRSK